MLRIKGDGFIYGQKINLFRFFDKFTDANDGTWHWAGSTGDERAPLNKAEIPQNVKDALGIKGKWR